jgi:asparagine synthase (glutamine-hydrolysing)
MSDRIAHRGPDDAGCWIDAEAGLVLAHRRLSILDLSDAGHQPMVSASGRYVVAFNGEIYNHLVLRDVLGADAPTWRGHSDTETLLACIDRWGLAGALERSVGMFALAVWDRHERRLGLARDRLGEKPCYYAFRDGSVLAASELKALLPHPSFRPEVEMSSVALFLRHGYVPSPHTIYRNTFKLPPGTFVWLDASVSAAPQPTSYWSLERVVVSGLDDPFRGDDEEAADALESHLAAAVARQTISDVPLGAFLSGGIDSSMVVALMQARASRPVRTFTVGFEDARYDESAHARAVADHLGTEHTELRVSPEDAMDALQRLPSLYDEPLADPSALPTYLVSRLARRSVTVSLSGDGGDELFGGYDRYRRAQRVWEGMQRVPRPLRGALAGAAGGVPSRAIASVLTALDLGSQPYLFAERVRTARATLIADSIGRLYRDQMSLWRHPEELMTVAVAESSAVLTDVPAWVSGAGSLESMMATDLLSYLPDDLLVKVDRAAMAVSLETRVPMLDPDVVAFAWRLPRSLKIRDGKGKWLLRKVLTRHLPTALTERPKMGFGVPIGPWLRGPLRGWAEELLSVESLRAGGMLRSDVIRRTFREHLAGKHDWQVRLWPVLVLQDWLRRGPA